MKSADAQREAKAIGKRVADLRKERGLSQREIAGPGISYAYISRIENGARRPSGKALKLIAAKLGSSVEYLETGQKAVTVLMLDDFMPYLAEHGFDPGKMTHDEIERLGAFVHEAIARSPSKNPLSMAVAVLKSDNELHESRTDHLFERAEAR